MVKSLHEEDISHGDLQHGNIMLTKNEDICLIDYDSLYIPPLSNEEDRIKCLDGYQHPSRSKVINLSPKSDYFSELIIYLSLLAISEEPDLWEDIEQEERLLFSKTDLMNPRSSPVFTQLTKPKKFSAEVVHFTLELERFCGQTDIQSLQPLEDFVNAYGGPNFPASKSSAKVPTSDPWSELDTNSSNASDKCDEPMPHSEDVWDKFDKPMPHPEDVWDKFDKPMPPDNIWNKFDEIWNKFWKSVASIWDKFSKWFD